MAALATALALLQCGCPIQFIADEISSFVDQPLNEFGADQVIGLQYRNDTAGAVTIDVTLDAAEGLTNRGPIAISSATFTGIEVPPGETIGHVSGPLSASQLALLDGTGLYPCVRGRICVTAHLAGGRSPSFCTSRGDDFACGQALLFVISSDETLSLSIAQLAP